MNLKIGFAMVIVALAQLAYAIPSELQQQLQGLQILHKGTCNFLADGSDPHVPCVVLDGGTVYYVIVGNIVNNSFRPVEVKKILKADPSNQETMWRDPQSLT